MALDLIFSILALYGSLVLVKRMVFDKIDGESSSTFLRQKDPVSIIIPCRNEEKNLPNLINSLLYVGYSNLEVIIVDDASTDNTAKIAEDSPFKLVRIEKKEQGWSGKTYASFVGASQAKGKYLLFTDADTLLDENCIDRSISFMKQRKLSILSALPYHENKEAWEKCLSTFHLFLLAVTKPFAKNINSKQFFAIGQFMVFTKESYEKYGGHKLIRNKLVDDLTIVKVYMDRGYSYGVYNGPSLFKVRMYSSLGDFIAGWRRNIRGGLKTLSFQMVFETICFYFAAIHTLGFNYPVIDLISICLCYGTILYSQSWLGSFYWFSPLLAP